MTKLFILPPKPEELFYLQCRSMGHIGNAPLFWSSGGGYTTRVAEFRKFTKQECDSIIRGSRGSHDWVAWPVEEIDGLAYLTVDWQDFTATARLGRK